MILLDQCSRGFMKIKPGKIGNKKETGRQTEIEKERKKERKREINLKFKKVLEK